jgi:hydrogenase/urease accessory protein HupE
VNGRALRLLTICVLCGLLGHAASVQAHPEGFSGLRISITNQRIVAIVTLHTRDLSMWFPAGKFPNYVEGVCAEMRARPEEVLEIQLGGETLRPAGTRCFSPETGMVQFEADYVPTVTSANLQVWSKHLARLPREHQQLLFVEDARVTPAVNLEQDTLSTEHDSVVIELQDEVVAATTRPAANLSQTARASTTRSTASRSVISFFALGVEHILTGYDHLLFLAGLLLVCDRFRQAAGVITLFTLAHSITLALAALNVVHLSPRIVEPAIAASILYVGIENIFGKHRFAWRAVVTFVFGLVHGLGFASALRDVGLGTTSVGLIGPLVKFNLGVEAGQLCVASVILPVFLLMKRRPEFSRRWVPACSVVVAAMGGYWLVARAFAG